jgi:hypothetical protein
MVKDPKPLRLPQLPEGTFATEVKPADLVRQKLVDKRVRFDDCRASQPANRPFQLIGTHRPPVLKDGMMVEV